MKRHEIKEEIKKLAREITEAKEEFKQSQRKLGNQYWNDAGDYYWDMIKKQDTYNGKRFKFRHYHIAASLERGRTYEEIERPKDGNRPNFSYIEEIRGRFRE